MDDSAACPSAKPLLIITFPDELLGPEKEMDERKSHRNNNAVMIADHGGLLIIVINLPIDGKCNSMIGFSQCELAVLFLLRS